MTGLTPTELEEVQTLYIELERRLAPAVAGHPELINWTDAVILMFSVHCVLKIQTPKGSVALEVAELNQFQESVLAKMKGLIREGRDAAQG